MDKRSRYSKILRILKEFKDGDEVGINRLRSSIMLNIGMSERVISETLNIMLEFGFLVEVEHLIFRIIKSQDTLKEIVKEESKNFFCDIKNA